MKIKLRYSHSTVLNIIYLYLIVLNMTDHQKDFSSHELGKINILAFREIEKYMSFKFGKEKIRNGTVVSNFTLSSFDTTTGEVIKREIERVEVTLPVKEKFGVILKKKELNTMSEQSECIVLATTKIQELVTNMSKRIVDMIEISEVFSEIHYLTEANLMITNSTEMMWKSTKMVTNYELLGEIVINYIYIPTIM